MLQSIGSVIANINLTQGDEISHDWNCKNDELIITYKLSGIMRKSIVYVDGLDLPEDTTYHIDVIDTHGEGVRTVSGFMPYVYVKQWHSTINQLTESGKSNVVRGFSIYNSLLPFEEYYSNVIWSGIRLLPLNTSSENFVGKAPIEGYISQFNSYLSEIWKHPIVEEEISQRRGCCQVL